MKLDCVRRQRALDIVLLVCMVGLAVATWAAISHADGPVGGWKDMVLVSVAMFLALAAVTPHERWALSVRLAMSGWLVTAPWLAFEELPSARWACLIIGSLLAVLSAPEFLGCAAPRSVQDVGSA